MNKLNVLIVSMAATMVASATGSVVAQVPLAQTGAQDASIQSLDSVVVTAQKREERLQDVPIAITALSSIALEERGIESLSDFGRTPAPGLQIQPFVGVGTRLIIDMRGVTNPDPTQGTAELSNAIYLDEVYLGRAQGLGMELADPERIEILRGPQGTLFGRNAQGGAVRIVSKRPTGFFGGNVKSTLGEYGTVRHALHLNLPEIAGIAFKLDTIHSNLDGYTRNPRSELIDRQLDFGYNRSEGYRASMLWNPLDTLEIYYSYELAHSKSGSEYQHLVRPEVTGPDYIPPPHFLGAQRDSSVHERARESFIGLYTESFRIDTHGHTLHLDYQINDDVRLRSITSYRTLDESGADQLSGAYTLVPLGPAGVPAGAFAARADTSGLYLDPATPVYAVSGVVPYNLVAQDQKSQEFQLIGSSEQVEYVAGLYYFTEDVEDLRQTFFSIMYTEPGTPNFGNPVGTNPFSLPFPGQGATQQSARTRSYAAFVQATWTPLALERRLHLTAGLRFTSDEKSFRRSLQSDVPVDLRPDDFDAKRWDPAATVAFDFTANLNGYLRYAQAYRSGGVSVRSPTFRPYNESVNKAWEMGLKSELLDRRLRANVAVFQNRLMDNQVGVMVDPTNPSLTDTINVPGTTRIQGMETELHYMPTSGLLFSLSYAYQDVKQPEDALRTLDPGANFYVQGLFRHMGMLAVDYTVPTHLGEMLLHLDYARGNKAPGTTRVPIDDHAWELERNVANARVTLRKLPIGPVSLRLSVFVNNVFDKAYPVFVAPGSNAAMLAPRMFGVDLGFDF